MILKQNIACIEDFLRYIDKYPAGTAFSGGQVTGAPVRIDQLRYIAMMMADIERAEIEDTKAEG